VIFVYMLTYGCTLLSPDRFILSSSLIDFKTNRKLSAKMGNHCNCVGRPSVDDEPLLPGYAGDRVSQRGPPPPYEVSKLVDCC